MTWSSSDRAARLPGDWAKRRSAVRTRAGNRCEWVDNDGRCTLQGRECDHVEAGDNHDLSNLQWLCRPHHEAKSLQEATEARRRYYGAAKRAPERHPGRD